MKTRVLWLADTFAFAENTLTTDERAGGWKLIFNGVTTDGWLEVTGLPFPKTWKIEDGCLKTVPSANGNQDIRTVDTFRDFDFSFDWKIAKKGNSGVKYLVQKTDRWKRPNESDFSARARGMEYQLLDDAEAAEVRSDFTRGTASLYSYLAPKPRVFAEPEKFHTSRIVVKGNRVEHWYDGVRVLEYELTQDAAIKALKAQKAASMQRESMISLQNHDGEVWFCNLKIRILN